MFNFHEVIGMTDRKFAKYFKKLAPADNMRVAALLDDKGRPRSIRFYLHYKKSWTVRFIEWRPGSKNYSDATFYENDITAMEKLFSGDNSGLTPSQVSPFPV